MLGVLGEEEQEGWQVKEEDSIRVLVRYGREKTMGKIWGFILREFRDA